MGLLAKWKAYKAKRTALFTGGKKKPLTAAQMRALAKAQAAAAKVNKGRKR